MANIEFKFAGRASGFSLIELMTVVAIIAILASIALPAYDKYVLRGKRVEGRAHLFDAAAILERYYSDNNRYANAANTFPSIKICKTASSCTTAPTETGKYDLTINTGYGTAYQTYTLTADPTFDDPECGNFTLRNDGLKRITGTGNVAECWNR